MHMNSKKINIVLLILLGISLITIASLYNQLNALKNPGQQQVAQVVSAVGKLMLLPTNETPTVATVSDPSKLKDQPFFANSQAGDEVLVYQQNRIAILYSPDQNKIIQVSPLNISAPAPSTQTTASQTTTTTTTATKKK